MAKTTESESSVSVDAPSKVDQNERAEHSLFDFEKIPPNNINKSLFAHQSTRKNQDLFDKWNLTPGLAVPKYRVVERRKNGNDRVDDETTRRANMVRGLFSDAKVRSDLGLLRPDERPSSSSYAATTNVEVARLSCDAVTMDFFDPLVEHDVLSESGHVRGCVDEIVHGLTVQDKLRRLFARRNDDASLRRDEKDEDDDGDEETKDLFSKEDRNELLYHILGLVCVGGSMCQAEDRFDEWKTATRDLYKDLVSVVWDETKGSVVITSEAYHVDPSGSNLAVFPRNSPHNKCYVVVDEVGETTEVTVLYKAFEPYW